MNALSHEFDLTHAIALPPLGGDAQARKLHALADQWDALHAAADAVAELAQLAPGACSTRSARLPAALVECDAGRTELALRGAQDLCAVMHTGLRALLVAVDRGQDATAAAVTLWREFHAGREAIRALAGPTLARPMELAA